MTPDLTDMQKAVLRVLHERQAAMPAHHTRHPGHPDRPAWQADYPTVSLHQIPALTAAGLVAKRRDDGWVVLTSQGWAVAQRMAEQAETVPA